MFTIQKSLEEKILINFFFNQAQNFTLKSQFVHWLQEKWYIRVQVNNEKILKMLGQNKFDLFKSHKRNVIVKLCIYSSIMLQKE